MHIKIDEEEIIYDTVQTDNAIMIIHCNTETRAYFNYPFYHPLACYVTPT